MASSGVTFTFTFLISSNCRNLRYYYYYYALSPTRSVFTITYLNTPHLHHMQYCNYPTEPFQPPALPFRLYLYISTSRSKCAVPNMAAFCSSLMYFAGILPRVFLNDFEMVIVTGVTLFLLSTFAVFLYILESSLFPPSSHFCFPNSQRLLIFCSLFIVTVYRYRWLCLSVCLFASVHSTVWLPPLHDLLLPSFIITLCLIIPKFPSVY